MTDIFISYAREDRETAKTLAQALTDQGWSVWWDRRIRTGGRFYDVIDRELTAARCVIVLWSKAALMSSWVREIVFTQMTKADVFTLGAGGQHVADFDVGIDDDDAVDEQQHELPALLEGGRGKPVLHTRTEGLEGCGDAGELLLTGSVAAELLLLSGQGPDALLQVVAPALILIERDDRSEIGVGEPFDLLVQARLAAAEHLASREQFLREPRSTMSTREGCGKRFWLTQKRAEVLPDQRVER